MDELPPAMKIFVNISKKKIAESRKKNYPFQEKTKYYSYNRLLDDTQGNFFLSLKINFFAYIQNSNEYLVLDVHFSKKSMRNDNDDVFDEKIYFKNNE